MSFCFHVCRVNFVHLFVGENKNRFLEWNEMLEISCVDEKSPLRFREKFQRSREKKRKAEFGCQRVRKKYIRCFTCDYSPVASVSSFFHEFYMTMVKKFAQFYCAVKLVGHASAKNVISALRTIESQK